MRFFLISALSWLAGLFVYVCTLAVFWDESIDRGDLGALLFWSAFAALTAVCVSYAPVMFTLHRKQVTQLWKYVIAGVGLGVVPVLLIIMIFGGNPSSLFSPEAGLFFCMFAAFGAVFGTGFFYAYRGERSN